MKMLALALMAAPATAETSVPTDARSATSLRPYSGIFFEAIEKVDT